MSRFILVPRREIHTGMVVGCPTGAHNATVTGDAGQVTLDCGHEVTMFSGHGLFRTQ